MVVTYDPDADATYVSLSEGEVARTDSLSDLIAVDLNAAGAPIGVELLKAPGSVSAGDAKLVTARYPSLKVVFETLRQAIAQSA